MPADYEAANSNTLVPVTLSMASRATTPPILRRSSKTRRRPDGLNTSTEYVLPDLLTTTEVQYILVLLHNIYKFS